ncbi:MAG: Flp pilus assembly complex ATPase component TadA [Phycisphaerae bacterium]|nr:Flp pilus assembly complex ATPase component TadA [Phycisphaerae bacterium]
MSGETPKPGGAPAGGSASGVPAPTGAARGGRMRVGEALLQDGAISAEQLEAALIEQARTKAKLGELLVTKGMINSGTLARALARTLGVRGVALRHGLTDPALLHVMTVEEWQRLRCMPMFKVHGVMTVAMADPQSLPTIDRLKAITGCKIRPVLALEANIVEFLGKAGSGDAGTTGASDVQAFLTSLSESDVEVVERERVDEGPATDLDRMVAGSPIVNLVNIAFLTAVKDRASDIHIEPDKKGTRVRYRIDGVLRELMRPPVGMHAAVVSRVKVIGKMDIAEKRLPQEGRVRIVAEGREIDLRISSMPTLLGEKIVVRILDKANLKVRLEDLGFRPEALETFNRVLRQPHGLVLVTGPTGSGKTTTLYSALDLLRSPEVNLLTVEDPVEYQLDMVNQIQVNEPVGLTFARALRSILRQDPDVIMVGEIRDEETARVAVQAALTGHLVLATLHANDAPGSVARLSDMGIESYLLSSALNGAVAQRLARTICPSCATKYYPSPEALADAGLQDHVGRSFRKGAGCVACHDSGFQGRLGVYEVMEVTPELRRLIHRSAPTHEMRDRIKKCGGLNLRDEGVLIALEGKTSLEEILRVTQDEGADLDAPAATPAGKAAPSAEPERRAAA